jgi:Uma2 family endonuclease
MVTQVETKRNYSLLEYFELEINALERHEYINGKIISLASDTPNHNRIIGNLSATLNFAYKNQPYEFFFAGQRLWIPERRIVTYPDVMVVSGEIQLQEGRKDTIINPLMITEVLSASTCRYDKDEKFAAYRTIPSFQEYMLVDQYSYHIERYYKTTQGNWVFSEYKNLIDIVDFHSFSLQTSLADIYDKVSFALEPAIFGSVK